jgi:hypothetical protein
MVVILKLNKLFLTLTFTKSSQESRRQAGGNHKISC